MSLTIPSFHDATIETLTYNWIEKSLTVSGLLCSHNEIKFILKFIDCAMLVIPQSDEWGPSESILEIEKHDDKNYKIQMQSGDAITIQCRDLIIQTHEIT